MSNFNKSEHFWESKKAFEILANLGLEPLSIVGLLPNYTPNIDKFTPISFTTPLTARAVCIYAPIKEDFQHNPWLSILCMGTIQTPCQPSLFSTFGLWWGVSIQSSLVIRTLATLYPIRYHAVW